MGNAQNKWLDLVVYEVYLRSFADGNGDGIGDLRGLREKLDYLQELGVNAVWITPCYESPDVDNGYDISNYFTIDKKYGTLDEWKELVADMHARGMKIIMDLVVNHTSDKHEWFVQGRTSKNNPYHDYYLWADEPKTSWGSTFGGSAWEYNEPTGEYYLHLFAKEQPDLNWENEQLREEVRKIVDFWVDLGVDGFRCDVLDHISKDFEKGTFTEGPHLHEYLRELFNRENMKNVFTVGECSSGFENISKICGKDRGELTCIFQFDHIGLGRKNKWEPGEFRLRELRDIFINWQNFCAKQDLIYTLFTDNHDQARFADRLCIDRLKYYEKATCIAATTFLLKGIPFLYQGQEFGMRNDYKSNVRDFDDVETKGYYADYKGQVSKKEMLKRINYGSRDNARCPLAWTKSSANGYGFGSNAPWISINVHAGEQNLEVDREREQSIFKFYQEMLAMRKKFSAIRYGEFENHSGEKNAFIFTRTYQGERALVICNYEERQTIALPSGQWDLVLTNRVEKKEKENEWEFEPYEIAVYIEK